MRGCGCGCGVGKGRYVIGGRAMVVDPVMQTTEGLRGKEEHVKNSSKVKRLDIKATTVKNSENISEVEGGMMLRRTILAN